MSNCCLSGFKWDGKLTGQETRLGGNNTYVTGSNKEVSISIPLQPTQTDMQHQAAIVILHDIYGWTSPNPRLLADHYAQEADATVYLPDL